MPAYEYQCRSCDGRFEWRQKMSDPELAICPACGGEVKRLISGGAGVVSKGSAAYAPSAPACAMGECCIPEASCGAGCGCAH